MDIRLLRKMFPLYCDLFMGNSIMYKGMIEFFVKTLKNMSPVLDAGSGTGNLTLRLLKERCYVTAIDRFGHLLKILEKKCSGHSHFLKTHDMDATKLNFGTETFNGIGSMFLVPMPLNYDFGKHLSESYRILINGGKFIITSLVPDKELLESLHSHFKEEMAVKGIIEKHPAEWNRIIMGSNFRKELVMSKNITQRDVLGKLEKIGFRNMAVIPERQNPYGKYAYLITCTK